MINFLPENLIRNAQDLQNIGVRELAWQYKFIFEVLNVLNNNNCIILGGDVYKIDNENGQISSTGDSWYFNKILKENDVIESCRRAKDYITNYHNRNGEYFCYSVVCEVYNS